jgi:hypothetical protein
MSGIDERRCLRERLKPVPRDSLYLELSNFHLAIQNLREGPQVLDLGSGVLLYMPLFNSCICHRADLTGRSLHFQYGPD